MNSAASFVVLPRPAALPKTDESRALPCLAPLSDHRSRRPRARTGFPTVALATLAIAFAALTPSLIAAQVETPAATPPYTAHRIAADSDSDGEIKIDGVMDEAQWSSATVVRKFWEWTPGENAEPPVPTEFRIMFDQRNLYVGVHAFDPNPERIRAHLMDRDAIDTLVQDDYVLVMLDTFNDHRRAFQFRVNPLGVQADALNGYVTGFEDWSWDILWDSAGKLTDDGYVVEMRFPFNQLSFPEVHSDEAGVTTGAQVADKDKVPGVWRISLGRSWPRDQRHRWASYPTRYGDACGTCAFNEVAGFVDLQPGRAFEVVPTLTAGRTDSRDRVPDGDLMSGDEEADLGVSGRWNINQSTRLSFAVNPDFSQVEADAAQLNVNERFALFFPEQRPFFLEDVDIFNTPLQAVFTRTVADPDWGLKMTTKKGKNAIGVFASQDNVNNVILPGNQGSRFASSKDGLLDPDVLGSVVRYRRDVGERNALGFLYAGREGDDYANHVVGFDGSVRLAASDTVTFQALHSSTEYPDPLRSRFGLPDEKLGGEAFQVNYRHFDRDWNWGARAGRFDREFRADSGFIPRVDVQRVSSNIERVFWLEDKWLTLWSVGGNASRSEDTSGLLTDSRIGLSATASGPKQSLLFGQTWTIDKRNGPTLFEDLTGGEIFFEMQPNGSVRLEFYSSFEEEVDFANNRQADLLQLSPVIGLKIGRRIQTNLKLFRRTFSNENGTYLRADLAELRVFYHFNTRSFVRAIVQRTAQTNDPAEFNFPVEREVEDLFSQLLFSYKLNAQTVLFAGYSDSRVGNDTFSLTQTERSIFLKIGYAFVL